MISMQYCITLVYLTITLCNSLPLGNERWRNPCGTQKQLISNIIEKLNKGIDIVTKLKANQIIRVNNPTMISLVDSHSSEMEIPDFDENSATTRNISWHHQEVYRQVSIVLIFLEQVRYNETIFKENNGNHFLQDITHLETVLYDVLCDIKSDLALVFKFISQYQSRDVVPSMWRSATDRLSVDLRDYIIYKDINLILQPLSDLYTDIQELIAK